MENTKYLDKDGLKLLWEKIKNKYSDAFTGKEIVDQIEKSADENTLYLKSKIVSDSGKASIGIVTHSKAYNDNTSYSKNEYRNDNTNDIELDNNRLRFNSYRVVFTSISSSIANTDTYPQGGCEYNGMLFVPMTNARYVHIIDLSTLTKVGQIAMPTVSGWTIHANTIQVMTIDGVLKMVISAEDVSKPGLIFYNLKKSGSTYTATFDKAIAIPSNCDLLYANTIICGDLDNCYITGYKKITGQKGTTVTDEEFYLNPPNTVRYIRYSLDYSNETFTKSTDNDAEIILPFCDCTQGMFWDKETDCIVQPYGYRGNKRWFSKLRIIQVHNNCLNKYAQYRFDDRIDGTFPQDKYEVQSLTKYNNNWYAVISVTNGTAYWVAKVEFERSYMEINGSDYIGLYYKGDEYRLNIEKAISLGILQK